MRSRHQRVAVIGAGISGVNAAAHLRKEGLAVTVFERSSAAGGIWYARISRQHGLHLLIDLRLYDERRPLEPSYPSALASKAEERSICSHSEIDALNNTEIERLLHAPPGYSVIPHFIDRR